jgi:leader peptidase (prepilin peptidase)/N-methyltransferase
MDAINQYMALHPTVTLTFLALLGLTIGSFLNVVIFRLPKMMENDWKCQCRELLELDEEPAPKLTLSTPNSTCPHCHHEIRPWENIPVLSYLYLRGKCGKCRAPISLRYPIIELATCVLTVMTVAFVGLNTEGIIALIFVWLLIAMAMIDFDTKLLPDNLTLPLMWVGILANLFGIYTTLEDAIWGAVAGYLSLWSVYHLFRLITGKEGMGYGDFKLLAALGAWMGWQYLPVIILLSSVVGAVVGISLILVRGRDRNIPIPFGPYLAAAGWIAFLWGDQIIASYLRFALPAGGH